MTDQTTEKGPIAASLPDFVAQSTGVGVQSTVITLLAIDGHLPKPDVAIFADTGWEPAAVYAQADRLEAACEAAGIRFLRVSNGNLRRDAIDPEHRYASIPYFVRNPPFTVREPVAYELCPACPLLGDPDDHCIECGGEGRVPSSWIERPATDAEREGMGRRQCTSEYKLAPIMRKIRELLGARGPAYRRVPKGRWAEQWVGFSTDEVIRANRRKDSQGVQYLTTRYPLLDLEMSRDDCLAYLIEKGWGDTEKSACIGCPYHGNAQWRELRDNRPDEWADAVAFDAAIRKGGSRGMPLDGEAFLHRSRLPLSIAPIDHVTRSEREENGEPNGCSPYGCRADEAPELALAGSAIPPGLPRAGGQS